MNKRVLLSYTFFLYAELLDIEVARQDAYKRQADGERILGASNRGVEASDWLE